jgi:hypothetical protein
LSSIIAVQGLGANQGYTWMSKDPNEKRAQTFPLSKSSTTHSTNTPAKVMWLRDLLPQYIPNARIATYSYPSEWLKSNWFTSSSAISMTLRDYGEQLLNELLMNRKASGVRVASP